MSILTIAPTNAITVRDVPCPVRACSGVIGAWCGSRGTPRADGFHDDRWVLTDRVTALAAPYENATALNPIGDLQHARGLLRDAIAAAAQRGRLGPALAGDDDALDTIVAAIARGVHAQQEDQ